MATGLREQKKEKTRSDIIAAAWALFRKKGYDATTIDEIARKAGISRRTFFRYFPTKEAVVFHNSADRLALFRSFLEERDERGISSVSRACLAIARHFSENREAVLEQYRLVESSPALIMREGEIDREWMAAIAETLAEGRSATARREARLLAGAIFGAMRATLNEWLAEDGRPDLMRLGNRALSLLWGRAA